MGKPERLAYDITPLPSDVPITLPEATTADVVAVPAAWKGRLVKLTAVDGWVVIRFSAEDLIANVVAASEASTVSVDGDGVITGGANAPHIRMIAGQPEHVYVRDDWTFFSYKTASGAKCDACPWSGDGR